MEAESIGNKASILTSRIPKPKTVIKDESYEETFTRYHEMSFLFSQQMDDLYHPSFRLYLESIEALVIYFLQYSDWKVLNALIN